MCFTGQCAKTQPCSTANRPRDAGAEGDAGARLGTNRPSGRREESPLECLRQGARLADMIPCSAAKCTARHSGLLAGLQRSQHGMRGRRQPVVYRLRDPRCLSVCMWSMTCTQSRSCRGPLRERAPALLNPDTSLPYSRLPAWPKSISLSSICNHMCQERCRPYARQAAFKSVLQRVSPCRHGKTGARHLSFSSSAAYDRRVQAIVISARQTALVLSQSGLPHA